VGLTTRTPIPFTSRIESFERSSVLTPQVVGFFVDRMNIGKDTALTPSAAISAARAGNFDEAIEASKASNNKLAPVFFDGLARYSKGDLEGAAGRFREALKLESDYFPAAFLWARATQPEGRIGMPRAPAGVVDHERGAVHLHAPRRRVRPPPRVRRSARHPQRASKRGRATAGAAAALARHAPLRPNRLKR
jgi:hypothetical protein